MTFQGSLQPKPQFYDSLPIELQRLLFYPRADDVVMWFHLLPCDGGELELFCDHHRFAQRPLSLWCGGCRTTRVKLPHSCLGILGGPCPILGLIYQDDSLGRARTSVRGQHNHFMVWLSRGAVCVVKDPCVSQSWWHLASPFINSPAHHRHPKQVTPARWERLHYFWITPSHSKLFHQLQLPQQELLLLW